MTAYNLVVSPLATNEYVIGAHETQFDAVGGLVVSPFDANNYATGTHETQFNQTTSSVVSPMTSATVVATFETEFNLDAGFVPPSEGRGFFNNRFLPNMPREGEP